MMGSYLQTQHRPTTYKRERRHGCSHKMQHQLPVDPQWPHHQAVEGSTPSVTGSPAIMVVLRYETDSGTEEASLESSTTNKISFQIKQCNSQFPLTPSLLSLQKRVEYRSSNLIY